MKNYGMNEVHLFKNNGSCSFGLKRQSRTNGDDMIMILVGLYFGHIIGNNEKW
jgi:hypothetical protein